MKIHFIVHEVFEAPGAYWEWGRNRGNELSLTKLYEGDSLPKDSSAYDMLIVMGGPQSPRTTLAECPYFDAAAEIALIQEFITADKPIIGVCLGAQLLGEAYGAKVEHSPEKEIGNFSIVLTGSGLADKHYAFQCHLEFSKPLVEALLAEEIDYDEQVKTHSYIQAKHDILAYDYSEMNHVLEQFLDAFTE